MEEKNRLPECEEMVMSVVWASKEDLNLQQVTDHVNAKYGKDWKIQTVATFLTRLEKKKYISIYRVGRYSHYHPEVTLEEYRKQKMEEVRCLLFDGDWYEMAEFIRRAVKAEMESET